MKHVACLLAALLTACGTISMKERSIRAGLSVAHQARETENDVSNIDVESSSTEIRATLAGNIPEARALEPGVEIGWRSATSETQAGSSFTEAAADEVDLLSKLRLYVITEEAPATPWIEAGFGVFLIDTTATVNNQRVTADGDGFVWRIGAGIQIAAGAQGVFDIGVFHRGADYDVANATFETRGLQIAAGFSLVW